MASLYVYIGDIVEVPGYTADTITKVKGLSLEYEDSTLETDANKRQLLEDKYWSTSDVRTVTIDTDTSVDLLFALRNFDRMLFDTKNHKLIWDTVLTGKDIPTQDVSVDIPTDIPMALKRANTVVNLGKL